MDHVFSFWCRVRGKLHSISYGLAIPTHLWNAMQSNIATLFLTYTWTCFLKEWNLHGDAENIKKFGNSEDALTLHSLR